MDSVYWIGPHFTPNVLVYTLAPDSDAELSGRDGIDVESKFVVYGGLWEDISQCYCCCWCQGSPGVEVQLVSVTSGPPQAPRPNSARRPDGTDCQPVSFRGRGG